MSKNKTKKKTPQVQPRPIDWLERASPQEIAEALLAVDQIKAYQVAAYLGERGGTEATRVLENVQRKMETDPLGTIARAFMGIAKG